MSKKLEIKQIAEELALSSTTVSRALSGKGRVSDATRQRVQEYIKANNAAPAVRRRSYTARKTRNILVTVAGERNYGLLPYFSQVIMGAYDFFQPLGYQVLVAKTSEDDIEPLKKVIKQHKCDGVILSRTLDNALDIRFLQEKGVPFVTIGSYDDNTLYQIDVDQRGGCKELTMRLLQQGVRNIALFAQTAHMSSPRAAGVDFYRHMKCWGWTLIKVFYLKKPVTQMWQSAARSRCSRQEQNVLSVWMIISV